MRWARRLWPPFPASGSGAVRDIENLRQNGYGERSRIAGRRQQPDWPAQARQSRVLQPQRRQFPHPCLARHHAALGADVECRARHRFGKDRRLPVMVVKEQHDRAAGVDCDVGGKSGPVQMTCIAAGLCAMVERFQVWRKKDVGETRRACQCGEGSCLGAFSEDQKPDLGQEADVERGARGSCLGVAGQRKYAIHGVDGQCHR